MNVGGMNEFHGCALFILFNVISEILLVTTVPNQLINSKSSTDRGKLRLASRAFPKLVKVEAELQRLELLS